MTFILAIIALGLLIFVHELGHFLVAKYYNICIQEFAIGFGPSLGGFRWGETLYSIRAIPLGGYVRMAGEDPHEIQLIEDEDEKESPEEAEHTSEAIAERAHLPTDKSRWFLTQPFLPKFLVVFAGPLFNVLFALLLAFASLAALGKPVSVDEPVIGSLMPGFPAEEAGLQIGDRIAEIDGTPVEDWETMAKMIRGSYGKPLQLTIERPGEGEETEQFQTTIQTTDRDDQLALLEDEENRKKFFKIGIGPSSKREAIGLGEAALYSGYQVLFITELTVKGLAGLVMGQVSAEHLAGPIYILKEGSKAAARGVDWLVNFMIFLSVSLALLNLLPIPVLDGGHLVFFILEAIRGKPVSIRTQEYATRFGMAVLLALMVFAISNDIFRIFNE